LHVLSLSHCMHALIIHTKTPSLMREVAYYILSAVSTTTP
jgi:hypothetical protein